MKVTHKKRWLFLIIVLIGILSLSNFAHAQKKPEIPKIPKVKVSYYLGPYADHSYAYIGAKKGMFKEVGITLTPPPYGKVISGDIWAHTLVTGAAEIGQNCNALLIPVLEETTTQKMIFYGDLTYGTTILGDPKKYKSLEEFINEGYSISRAWRATMRQLKGKTLLSEINAANKGLIDYAFKKAGMSVEKDVNLLLIEDPKIIAMLEAGKADLASPSAIPVIAHLQAVRGYKPIVNARMITKYADFRNEPEVFQVLLFCGLGTTEKWLEKNHDTALRVVSVFYRLMDFMNYNQDEAIDIHLPFLNSLTASTMVIAALNDIYNNWSPFPTFEERVDWYLNEDYIGYWKYNNEYLIKMWEEKGVLTPGKFKPEDVDLTWKIYEELLLLKMQSEGAMKKTELLIKTARAKRKNVTQAANLLRQAKHNHEIRNYLDAKRFSYAAKEWVEYSLR